MTKLLKTMLIMAVMVAAFASTAVAQSQEEWDAQAIHCTYTLQGSMWEDQMAQTFVAHRSGYLVSVYADLNAAPETEARGIMKITTVDSEGKPTDTIIASGVYSNRSEEGMGSVGWHGVYPGDPFPARVVAGQKYAITVDNQTESSTTYWHRAEESECQGGVFYRSTDGTWLPGSSSANAYPPNGNGSLRYTARIAYDETKPTGTIEIDGGKEITRDRWVQLDLTARDWAGYDAASGVELMRFKNAYSDQTWGAWQPFATTKYWQLSPGEGIKHVQVQYKDRAGNVSSGSDFPNDLSDRIRYDRY